MNQGKINPNKSQAQPNTSNSIPRSNFGRAKTARINQSSSQFNNNNIELENLKGNFNKEPLDNNVEANPAENNQMESLQYQIEELQLALENSKKENEEIKLIAQRAVADSQNLVHQHQLDIESNQKKLKKSVASQILHIINTLYLAFQYSPQTEDEKVINYLETIKKSFEKSIDDLKLVGIEIITAHKGDIIDFNTMNIINTPQEPTEEPKVSQVVSLGLRIDNQVVQPVTVMV